MRIALTTPTGHVGRAVAEGLLSQGVQLRLLARDPSKLDDLATRGGAVLQGSLEDQDFVVAATRGVDALFWVTPSVYDAENLRAEQNRFGRSAAAAILANGIPRVVNLSSLGAHRSSGVGPIGGLHDVEHILNHTSANLTHLRPGYFFENYLRQIDAINSSGSIFLPVSESARIPMIATADVAQAAIARLMDRDWTGNSVLELHGPADLSFEEAAAAISRAVGRAVAHFRISPSQAYDTMRSAGLSEDVSRTMLEMYEAIDSGLLRPTVPRSRQTTTPTTMLDFARTVMRRMTAEPVAR